MLLVLAAKHLPALFEGHVALLCRSLALSLDGDEDDEQDGEEGESERAVVVQCLAAVCAYVLLLPFILGSGTDCVGMIQA